MPEEKQPIVTPDLLPNAEKIIGLAFTDAERELMLDGLNEQLGEYEQLRSVSIDNSVPMALSFDPRLPGMSFDHRRRRSKFSRFKSPPVPSNLEALAFYPVTHLARLIRSRKVTSVALTEMYLERLKRYDPILKCVVSSTEDLAMLQARRADEEIAAGHYRGLLHGIPTVRKTFLPRAASAPPGAQNRTSIK